MRRLTTQALGFLLMTMAILACQSGKGDSKSESTASENGTAETAAEQTSESRQPFLNANLATAEDLRSLGLSEALIAEAMASRPFLTINAFDQLMSDSVDKSLLYEKIFVPMNLNTTPEADFKMIPGVGDRMAHEFEEYRPYASIKQFRKEIGKYVDAAEVARYENYVFVPVDLNTATEEDIKALPGVGDRMAHEFEEYRPYTSMEQFRKEIGKYVDDQELSRLERLVYIKE